MNNTEERRRFLFEQWLAPADRNRQQEPLVRALLRLYTQMEEGKELDSGDLSYVENKVRKVLCYSERFGGDFKFLTNYFLNRK